MESLPIVINDQLDHNHQNGGFNRRSNGTVFDEEEEVEEEGEVKSSQSMSQVALVVYTSALYFCFVACGLCFSIFNPTLRQLASILNSDLEHVSFIFPMRAMGCVVGTLTNGVLTTYLNRQLLLVCFLLLKSTTTFLVPHWATVQQFYGNAFFNGFFTSAIVVMVNVWLNELWSSPSCHNTNKTLANVLMQGLHFCYGLGCVLGPLLAEPFLSDSVMVNLRDSNKFLSNDLVLPYMIAASTAVLSSSILYIMFLAMPYQSQSKLKDDAHQSGDNALESEWNKPNNYLAIVLACIFMFVTLCSEGTYFQFSASFATETALKLSQPTGALLASILAVSFTIFRALSVVIAMKLSPGTMILLDLLTIVAGNLLVFFFADANMYVMATGYVLLGAGFSSIFPSFFPFLEQNNVQVTDWVGSLVTFAGGVAEVLAPFLIGLYIETHPYVLVYFCFVSVTSGLIMLAVLTIVLQLYSTHTQQRPNGRVEVEVVTES